MRALPLPPARSGRAVLTATGRRLLDGDAAWGTLTVQPDRFGTRYVLTVYPPGSTALDRRRIRIWRGSPIWGALLWIVAEAILTRHLHPLLALATSTTLLAGCILAAQAYAGAPRRQVRVLAATLLPRRYDPVSAGMCEAMQRLARILRTAESSLHASRMTPAQFELTWWQVYDMVASIRAQPAVIRSDLPPQ